MSKVATPIDWDQFDKLVWIPVLSNVQLADILDVSIRHLERQVRERYDNTIDGVRQQKQGPMRHKLFSAMWENAIKQRNVASQIWLSKNLFGWSDKLVHAQGDVTQEKLIINFSGSKSVPGKVDSGEPVQENAAPVPQSPGHDPSELPLPPLVQTDSGVSEQAHNDRDPGTTGSKS